MTRKIATKGVSDCVESHTYRMKKSIFIELSFLAFLLMPWQIAYLQELFFFLTWNEVVEHFGKSKKQGIKFMRSNFSFP